MTMEFHESLARDGAIRVAAAVSPDECATLLDTLARFPSDRPGIRLTGAHGLGDFLTDSGAIGRQAAVFLGTGTRPVRALLFDKSAATNWSLDWHQDRTIAVATRIDVAGFGPWTTKAGILHVAPPFDILNRMVTLRLHLDPVPPTNAPLLVAPGSHRLGRIAVADVTATVKRCGSVVCLADRGDIWVYSTPILHASHIATEPVRRRVLQVDYANFDLPGGLEWLGI